jgi:hypothetical protein
MNNVKETIKSKVFMYCSIAAAYKPRFYHKTKLISTQIRNYNFKIYLPRENWINKDIIFSPLCCWFNIAVLTLHVLGIENDKYEVRLNSMISIPRFAKICRMIQKVLGLRYTPT